MQTLKANLTHGDIVFVRNKAKSLSIGVVGDAMCDTYVHCNATRLNPEAPVPVLVPESTSRSLGGAANVVANVKAVVGEKGDVNLLAAIANDKIGLWLTRKLSAPSIAVFKIRTCHKTTEKVRFTVGLQQVVRVDFEEQTSYLRVPPAWLKSGMDMVVVADYAKGVVSNVLRNALMDKKLWIAVSPKPPNRLDWRGVKVAVLNLKELMFYLQVPELSAPPANTFVEAWANRLRIEWGCEVVLITMGARGMIVVEHADTWYLPATCQNPVSVAGAGDTALAAFSVAYRATDDAVFSAKFACACAAQVVSEPGTSILDMSKL